MEADDSAMAHPKVAAIQHYLQKIWRVEVFRLATLLAGLNVSLLAMQFWKQSSMAERSFAYIPETILDPLLTISLNYHGQGNTISTPTPIRLMKMSALSWKTILMSLKYGGGMLSQISHLEG